MKKGWEQIEMGKLCSVASGESDTVDAVENGAYAFFDRSKTIKRSTRYLYDCEALIIPGEGKEFLPRYYKGRFDLHQRAYALFDFSPKIEPRFLFHYLYHFSHYLPSVAVGATVKSLRRRHFLNLPVAVTSPAEQRRIVEVLEEAFAGLATAQANAEKNLQNARALFESHLHSVFTHRGKGWLEKRLGDIGRVSMCKRVFKEETTSAGDIPFYKIGTFGKEPDAFIPSRIYHEYRAKYPFPKKGDVLISAAGTIGRRVKYDGEPAYFQDSNIVWIDNDEKQVLNDYLYHLYGACEWNSTSGATISRLYNDDLRRIVISFPESQQDQRRITAQLDALSAETQRLARLYERKLAALAELKKSLLHAAFSGQL